MEEERGREEERDRDMARNYLESYNKCDFATPCKRGRGSTLAAFKSCKKLT